jgi:hypothetical protein
MSSAITTFRNPAPRFGGSRTIPRLGSTGPGEEMPMPAIADPTSEGADSRAVTSA